VFQCNIHDDYYYTHYNFNLFVLSFFLILSPTIFFTSSPSIAAAAAATSTPHFYNRRADEKKKNHLAFLYVCYVYVRMKGKNRVDDEGRH
jgi:hypothetical protein